MFDQTETQKLHRRFIELFRIPHANGVINESHLSQIKRKLPNRLDTIFSSEDTKVEWKIIEAKALIYFVLRHLLETNESDWLHDRLGKNRLEAARPHLDSRFIAASIAEGDEERFIRSFVNSVESLLNDWANYMGDVANRPCNIPFLPVKHFAEYIAKL